MTKNISKETFEITRKQYEKFLNQKGRVYFFTGLSGSGKSTISKEFIKYFHNEGKFAISLDGDNLRFGLNSDLGFTDEDREENIRRVGELCKLYVEQGIIVLASFICPFEKSRKFLRELIGNDYNEVYVKCPLEVCMERDPKGLYKKNIKNFTGKDSNFEEPQNADIIVNTDEYNLSKCVDIVIWDFLENKTSKQ